MASGRPQASQGPVCSLPPPQRCRRCHLSTRNSVISMLSPPLCRAAAGAEAGLRRLQGTELRLSSAHGLVSRPVESLATLQSELVEEWSDKPQRASQNETLSVSERSLGFSFPLCLFIVLEALMWDAPGACQGQAGPWGCRVLLF